MDTKSFIQNRAQSETVAPGTMVAVEVSSKHGKTVINATVVRQIGGILCLKSNLPIDLYEVESEQLVDAWFPYVRRLAPLKGCRACIANDGSNIIEIYLPSAKLPRNRRIAIRENFRLPVAITRSGGIWRARGETVNISGSGAMIQLDEKLEIAERVRISMKMPDEEGGVLSGHADVVWSYYESGGYHYGLKFAEIHDTFVKRLCRITLRKRKQRRSIPPD